MLRIRNFASAPTQGTEAAKREEQRKDLDQTFRGVQGHAPPGNVLYLGLLNWCKMHLKLPCSITFLNQYSLRGLGPKSLKLKLS